MYLIHLNQEETMAEIFSVGSWSYQHGSFDRPGLGLSWHEYFLSCNTGSQILHNPLLNYKRFSRNTSCSYSLCHLRGYPSTSLSQFWVHEYLLPRSMSRWENHICPIPLWYVLWNLEHVFKWKLPININGYQLLT